MRFLLFIVCIALITASCSSRDSKSAGEAPATGIESLSVVHLDVKGMTCEGCEKAIITSLEKLEGINEATASHMQEEVVVQYDSTQTDLNHITAAIESAGYNVE